MGLISALVGSVGGVLADQWKEFFYCDSMEESVLVTKGQKRIGNRSSNTKGSDNVISNGSGIVVNDGQCMIIVENGKIVEVCAEPGQFTYDTSLEPSIFAGSLGESIKQTFKEIGKRFTYGGDTGKDQRVYYFNTKEILDNKFGTPTPIPFRVVDSKIGLDIDVPNVEKKKPVISNGFIFDEEGYIVKENLTALKNPFHKEYETKEEPKVEKDSKKWAIFNNVKFDENGYVIADGTETEEATTPVANSELASKIKFDENGFVVADGTEEETAPAANSELASKIKFDENGFVVADGSEEEIPSPAANSELASKIKFDENGFVVADGTDEETTSTETVTTEEAPKDNPALANVKFDENGFVVSVE